MRTQLSEHVVFEDHPQLGISFWHNLITGEFDRRIDLNEAAEEKLLELLQARAAVRKHQADIAHVVELLKVGNDFVAEALQIDYQITDAELKAAMA